MTMSGYRCHAAQRDERDQAHGVHGLHSKPNKEKQRRPANSQDAALRRATAILRVQDVFGRPEPSLRKTQGRQQRVPIISHVKAIGVRRCVSSAGACSPPSVHRCPSAFPSAARSIHGGLDEGKLQAAWGLGGGRAPLGRGGRGPHAHPLRSTLHSDLVGPRRSSHQGTCGSSHAQSHPQVYTAGAV